MASLLGAALFILSSSYPFRFGFDRAVAGQLLKFGLPLAGTSIIVFAVGYAEQMTTGAVLGATALGYYVLAFNLASWPVNMFSQPLRSVAPAAFSRLQDDEPRMNTTFVSLVHAAGDRDAAGLRDPGGGRPAGDRVRLRQGLAAGRPVLRFLAVLAALRILFELAYDYLVVRRRSGHLLVVQLVWLVALLPVLWYAAHRFGLAGVAAGQLLVVAVIVLPLYLGSLGAVDVPHRGVLGVVTVPLLASRSSPPGSPGSRTGSTRRCCSAWSRASSAWPRSVPWSTRTAASLRAVLGGAR